MTKGQSKFALRDKLGTTHCRGSYDDCLARLHTAQPKDWHHAVREGGWTIDRIDEAEGKARHARRG